MEVWRCSGLPGPTLITENPSKVEASMIKIFKTNANATYQKSSSKLINHLNFFFKDITGICSVSGPLYCFTLPTEVRLVKAMVFPVVMYGCESWTVKKAECWRTDAFELWCWRRLLTVPWTARRSNQPILKEISPRCSLEGLMLKLKLQYLYFLGLQNHWRWWLQP